MPTTITVTYNSNGTLSCSPDKANIANNTSDKVTVNLVLGMGVNGHIAFQSDEFKWINSKPKHTVTGTGATRDINVTNDNNKITHDEYPFAVNVTYTPDTGPSEEVTGDPTIVNEGTAAPGSGGDDHGKRHGEDHGRPHHG